jgi:hypothetical protein
MQNVPCPFLFFSFEKSEEIRIRILIQNQPCGFSYFLLHLNGGFCQITGTLLYLSTLHTFIPNLRVDLIWGENGGSSSNFSMASVSYCHQLHHL